MTLHWLFLNSLIPGATKFTDKRGFGFSFTPNDQEHFSIFQTDRDDGIFVKDYAKLPSSLVCDCVCFHSKSFNSHRLLFIELKGGDIEHASNQIIATINILQAQLGADFTKFKARSLIIAHSATIIDFAPYRQRIKRETGITSDLRYVDANEIIEINEFIA